MSADPLAPLRRDYARRMLAIAGVTDQRLEQAFATIRREDFLGPPPWRYVNFGLGETGLADRDDVAPIYDDVLVALDPAQGLNNGSPALHAMMLHRLAVAPGDHVLHVGAGGGYYTAILVTLAGPMGHVTAVEYDPVLARLARDNLRPWPNCGVIEGDGAAWPDEAVQRIYVNCACADIPDRWLDQLTDGGRLELPLGGPAPSAHGAERRNSSRAAVFVITRAGAGYAAEHVVPCAFICAEGPLAGSRAQQDALYRAFGHGGVEHVRSLTRQAVAPASCWFHTARWRLSFDSPGSATP